MNEKPHAVELSKDDRALLEEMRYVRQELIAAGRKYKDLRMAAFRRGIPLAAVSHWTGERYDALRMARSRARV